MEWDHRMFLHPHMLTFQLGGANKIYMIVNGKQVHFYMNINSMYVICTIASPLFQREVSQ